MERVIVSAGVLPKVEDERVERKRVGKPGEIVRRVPQEIPTREESEQVMKFPLFKDLQLGDLQRSKECGCLLFHSNRIDGNDEMSELWCEGPVSKPLAKLSLEKFTGHDARNTVANRRAAYALLKKSVRTAGYRILRDRTIVKIKPRKARAGRVRE